MSAPVTDELVDKIRQLYAEADEAGQPPPGRPTLIKLTGASDYRVRQALAELANPDDTTDADEPASAASPGDTEAGDEVADDQPHPHDDPGTGGQDLPVQDQSEAGASPATSLATLADPGHQPPPAADAVSLWGAKLVSWTGFVFGSVMSVAANVLHTWLPAARMPPGWSPGIASQIGAAVWPIGLLLSVEVLSRVPWPAGWQWNLARYGGTGIVALGSAVISYGHVRDVLFAWGYGELAAHVGPLVLDGLMVISGFALLAMNQTITNSTNDIHAVASTS